MSRKNVVTLADQLAAGSLIAPYIMDCLTGRMAENTGFRTYLVDSEAVAVGCGYADPAMVTRDELLGVVARTAEFFPYPVIADLGNGFSGSPYMVEHTVSRFAYAGAAAVVLDDSAQPEDPLAQKEKLIPAEQFEAKLRAAARICREHGLLLIAATNERDPAHANDRLKQCEACGADLVMARCVKGTGAQCRAVQDIHCGKMAPDLSGEAVLLEAAGYRIFAVRYVEKASLWGILELGRQCRETNSTVSVDYHTFDGMLPDISPRLSPLLTLLCSTAPTPTTPSMMCAYVRLSVTQSTPKPSTRMPPTAMVR